MAVGLTGQGQVATPQPSRSTAPPGPHRGPAASESAQAVRPEDKASIEGVVTNQITGAPLAKVMLQLRSMDRPSQEPLPAVSTQADGAFRFPAIDPGRYSLYAQRNGFASQYYGSRNAMRMGTTLDLKPAQKLTKLTFEMMPQGVITGRVTDEDGDPVASIQVQVMRFQYSRGKRQLAPFNMATTNDLGEYRVFGLAPGSYYVQAAFLNRGMMGTSPGDGYVPVYYPSSSSPERASVVSVTSGNTQRGIDLTLRKAHTVRVSGRVNLPDGARRSQFPMVFLISKTELMYRFDRTMSPVREGGKFEIRNVQAGSYVLICERQDESGRMAARLPIEVGTADVDGVELTLAPGVEITGEIKFEGEPATVTTPTDTTKGDSWARSPQVFLEPRGQAPFGGVSGPVGDDRKIRLKSVMPEHYTVQAYNTPPGTFVKSIRFGDSDITDTGLDFTQGATPGELTVVVSYEAGQISGTIETEREQKVSGLQIVAIPEGVSEVAFNRLVRTGSTDQNGGFLLKGVAPGDYRVYAFDEIEPGAFQDPEFIKPLESKGMKVTVRARSTESISLRVAQ